MKTSSLSPVDKSKHGQTSSDRTEGSVCLRSRSAPLPLCYPTPSLTTSVHGRVAFGLKRHPTHKTFPLSWTWVNRSLRYKQRARLTSKMKYVTLWVRDILLQSQFEFQTPTPLFFFFWAKPRSYIISFNPPYNTLGRVLSFPVHWLGTWGRRN